MQMMQIMLKISCSRERQTSDDIPQVVAKMPHGEQLCFAIKMKLFWKGRASCHNERSPVLLKAGDVGTRGWGVAWVGAGLEEPLSTRRGEAAVTAA